MLTVTVTAKQGDYQALVDICTLLSVFLFEKLFKHFKATKDSYCRPKPTSSIDKDYS